MKIEIKKVGLLSTFFSVFPVAVFAVMFYYGILEMFSPDVPFTFGILMTMIMNAIVNTILFLLATAVFLLVYNGLCAIGIRGVRVDLEDK